MRKISQPGLREFIAMTAAIMALNALGTDIMLPALPTIGQSLGVTDEARHQLIISAYMTGFGLTQILFGPLADRFGRRPVLLVSLLLYGVTSLLAAVASSFTLLLVARLLQGMAGAGGRVLAVSIVRDRYKGPTMARVMSLAFMVFLAVPIVAPAVGQAIILVAPWRTIFHVLALGGLLIPLWLYLRLPETLDPANRRMISIRSVAGAIWQTLRERQSLGYTFANTATFAALMGYIFSCPQIFAHALGRPEMLAPVFAVIATGLAISSYLNSRLVEAFGSRRLSHIAAVLFLAICTLHYAWALGIGETLASFTIFMFATMLCFGFMGANFGALAMEPMGRIAGTASSVQGSISTLGASTVGLMIGQSFDGSVLPTVAGMILCTVATLAILFVTERGRLFHAVSNPSRS